jgi:hypothetical protein
MAQTTRTKNPSMKTYKKPESIKRGTCFICKEECPLDAYCHLECAIAYDDEKTKRIKEAKECSP